VAAALKLLGSTFVPECLFYSFVSLPEGKMSTRRGRVVSLDDLLDESVELALAEVTKRRPELPESERNKIAQAVGIGAVRFNIVRVQAEKGIVFRWEEALNFEGSSAPFVQYAHARACSILRKAGQADLIDAPEKASLLLVEPWLLAEEPSCVALARTLERLPLVIEESAASVRPHPMATYALEAASAFNEFYRDVPVIGSDAAEGSRVALVAASRAALESILNLLAVAPLREM
jgi:arginyl-tRNA synthetase